MQEQNNAGGPPPLPPIRSSVPPQYSTAAPPVILQEEPESADEREVLAGGRYVIFEYCISVLVLSFKRNSGIVYLKPGQSGFAQGLPYSLISFFAGWWGIPWGPIWTIATIISNMSGGRDVTQEVLASKIGPSRAMAFMTKPRSAPATRSKKGFPAWGWAALILFIVAALGFGIYGFTLVLRNTSDHTPYPSSPGRAEFEVANKTIDFNRGTIAFGNSTKAIFIANFFSQKLKQFRETQFEGGKKNGFSVSEHEFMTYCDLQTNQCIFLVHVPELRRYTSDAKTAMSALAWETAQRVLRETKAGQTGQKLFVGVRGAIFYERVMIGNYVADLSDENKCMLTSTEGFESKERLYPAFSVASRER
jgi:hypothetical protein